MKSKVFLECIDEGIDQALFVGVRHIIYGQVKFLESGKYAVWFSTVPGFATLKKQFKTRNAAELFLKKLSI